MGKMSVQQTKDEQQSWSCASAKERANAPFTWRRLHRGGMLAISGADWLSRCVGTGLLHAIYERNHAL